MNYPYNPDHADLYYLGLDLSMAQTGIVLIDRERKIKYQGVIRSSKIGERPSDELARLNTIVARIDDVIKSSHVAIQFAAIEGIAFGIQRTTALAQLSALNYFTRNLLTDSHIPYVIVAPTTLKKFVTGSGKAGKEMMMLETLDRYGETFHNDNICDAYGLSLVARGLDTQDDLTKDQKSAIMNLRKQL